MNTRRGGLGRGLGALIPTAPLGAELGEEPGQARGRTAVDDDRAQATQSGGGASRDANRASGSRDVDLATAEAGVHRQGSHRPAMVPVPGATFAQISLADIRPNPKQPRQAFDEAALDELAHSLREVGFQQPVVVRPLGHDDTPDGAPHRYELVMGERRWRAAQQAGFKTIPAIVRETSDDALLRDALLENLHREQLNPLEEGAAYAQLLEEFGATHDELAKRIGRSRSQVSNTIRLLNLPASIQLKVAAGVLSAGHARALLGLPQRRQQIEVALLVARKSLSVRETENLVRRMIEPRREQNAGTASVTVDPNIARLQEELAEKLGARVNIEHGRTGHGRVVIRYNNLDELDGILSHFQPIG
ncbi:MAG: ParB/RepB/Spo0J family partition protein [Steroidobacteraceae bacterium]